MLSMRSAVAGLVCFFAPWVATGASQASSLTPGEYLTNGGWGNLKISKVLGRQLSFAIWSNGANGHSCYLRGSILNGNQGVPEISVPDKDCRLLFREDKGAIDVTTNGSASCRAFCGARAGFTGQYVRPPPSCGSGDRQRDHGEFERLYRLQHYAEARWVLKTMVEHCEAVFDWREKSQALNDIAITQHHLGQDDACIRTLQPLATEASVSDEALRAKYPPTDYERMQKIVNWTRTNLALCRRGR